MSNCDPLLEKEKTEDGVCLEEGKGRLPFLSSTFSSYEKRLHLFLEPRAKAFGIASYVIFWGAFVIQFSYIFSSLYLAKHSSQENASSSFSSNFSHNEEGER